MPSCVLCTSGRSPPRPSSGLSTLPPSSSHWPGSGGGGQVQAQQMPPGFWGEVPPSKGRIRFCFPVSPALHMLLPWLLSLSSCASPSGPFLTSPCQPTGGWSPQLQGNAAWALGGQRR